MTFDTKLKAVLRGPKNAVDRLTKHLPMHE